MTIFKTRALLLCGLPIRYIRPDSRESTVLVFATSYNVTIIMSFHNSVRNSD